jgi:hypothetical protein
MPRTDSSIKDRLRDEIIAASSYPRERWRRRTVRNVLVVLGDTRRDIAEGFALLNARTSEILKRMEKLEQQVDAVRAGSVSQLERSDLPPAFLQEREHVAAFSLVSIERDYALYESVRYIVAAGITGDIVECGVWAGGSAAMAARALQAMGAADRRIWLYDTFGEFPHPGEHDEWYDGGQGARQSPHTMAPSLEEVQRNMATTYHDDVVFVKGRVEDTIPAQAPTEIALLRLDTDWYGSTRHELEHLYPRLNNGGVLIVDDYGHYQGARRAVDEYFHNRPVLLNRIDYTGRLVIKT